MLSHVGYEFSLSSQDQAVGDPARLRPALEEGVTVIAAHGCSEGTFFTERFLPTFLDLVRAHSNFFADVSALTLPNRYRMLLKLRHHPEAHSRLLFGTDYPHLVFHLPCWGRTGWMDLRSIIGTKNRFDRQYAILNTLGVGFRSFEEVLPRSG